MIKESLQTDRTDYDLEKDMLRGDNLKLKREVIELRAFVKDLIGNFSGSRQGHSTDALT